MSEALHHITLQPQLFTILASKAWSSLSSTVVPAVVISNVTAVPSTPPSLITTKSTPQGENAHPPPNSARKDVSSGMCMELKGVVGS
eukprot:11585114-Ditylum_brightwellii.AAC.1